ncbi:hypothetical protein GGR50DRAFT_638208 [Xylaria sp. CBS 124048]|nr:hypothetical protein GGR50DRAFT_638208 [Xylaria sp. CBS 124048]
MTSVAMFGYRRGLLLVVFSSDSRSSVCLLWRYGLDRPIPVAVVRVLTGRLHLFVGWWLTALCYGALLVSLARNGYDVAGGLRTLWNWIDRRIEARIGLVFPGPGSVLPTSPCKGRVLYGAEILGNNGVTSGTSLRIEDDSKWWIPLPRGGLGSLPGFVVGGVRSRTFRLLFRLLDQLLGVTVHGTND